MLRNVRYKEAILQKNLLTADRLFESEINESEELLPKITDLCKKLSGYSIKKTIVYSGRRNSDN